MASSGELSAERDKTLNVINQLGKHYSNFHLDPILFDTYESYGRSADGEPIVERGIRPRDNSVVEFTINSRKNADAFIEILEHLNTIYGHSPFLDVDAAVINEIKNICC